MPPVLFCLIFLTGSHIYVWAILDQDPIYAS
jgi:hypothetical protein